MTGPQLLLAFAPIILYGIFYTIRSFKPDFKGVEFLQAVVALVIGPSPRLRTAWLPAEIPNNRRPSFHTCSCQPDRDRRLQGPDLLGLAQAHTPSWLGRTGNTT